MIRSVVRNVVRSVTRDVTTPIKRFFTEFLASVNSHATFDSAITLSGDFEIEFDFSSTGTSVQYLLGGSQWVRLEATGELTVSWSGGLSTTTQFNDGKLHKARLVKSGGQFTIFVDGIQEAMSMSVPASVSFDKVGLNFAAYFDGFIANLKITDAGTLAGFWSMDDAPNSTYFRNTAAVLGSELWTGTPNIGTGWVDNGDGSYSIDGTQVSTSYLRFTGKVTIGDSYLVGVTIEALSGGSVFFDVGGDFTTGFTTIGNHSVTAKAVNDSDLALGVPAGQTATVRLITAKETPAATPYLTKQNIASDQTELFDKVDDGWDAVANSFIPATVSGGWVDNLDGTYSKSTAVSGDLGELWSATISVNAGQVFKANFLLEDSVSTLNIFTRDAGANAAIQTGLIDGEYTLTLTAGDGGGLWFARTAYTGTVKQPVLKRFLEEA